jgi:hypothetical protein
MDDMRWRPKGNYSNKAELGQLCALAGFWRSEIAFYKDELRFFKSLADKYMIWLTRASVMKLMGETSAQITTLSIESESLSERVEAHCKDLTRIEENSSKEDEDWFRQEHGILEEDIADFVSSVRKLKAKLFSDVEKVIDTEKLYDLQH